MLPHRAHRLWYKFVRYAYDDRINFRCDPHFVGLSLRWNGRNGGYGVTKFYLMTFLIYMIPSAEARP